MVIHDLGLYESKSRIRARVNLSHKQATFLLSLDIDHKVGARFASVASVAAAFRYFPTSSLTFDCTVGVSLVCGRGRPGQVFAFVRPLGARSLLPSSKDAESLRSAQFHFHSIPPLSLFLSFFPPRLQNAMQTCVDLLYLGRRFAMLLAALQTQLTRTWKLGYGSYSKIEAVYKVLVVTFCVI